MRKKQSVLIHELLSFPWWLNLILAVLIYAGLTWVAPAMLSDNRLLHALALGVSQHAWILSGLLVLTTLGSVLQSYCKQRLLGRQQGLASVHTLSWKAFEELVAEYWRRDGYTVKENISGGADGGVDVTLRKDGQLVLVQCKHWKTRKVGVTIVRELLGVMTARHADGGMVVTSGEFTAEAIRFARDQPMTLINGHQLVHLVKRVQQTGAEDTPQPVVKPAAQSCPRCNAALILRTARQGQSAGTQFWGCARFPECRYTLNYDRSH